MITVFVVIGILYLVGGVGFLFINRKLDHERRRENWRKYFYYLLIISIVLGSASEQRVFAALFILVSSVGLMEMMHLSQKADRTESRKKFLLISMVAFTVIFSLFVTFILLPSEVIIYTYVIILIFDGACQVTGQLFGNHKIAPKISPNKTWEGFVYGSLFALLTAYLLRHLVSFSGILSIAFGIIVCCAGFAGDLMASSFKRAFGAKNFSNLLPGQGGVLDRFDSFLVAGGVIGLLGIPFLVRVGINQDILVYLVMTAIFLTILVFGEFICFFFKVRPEFARMITHCLAGLTCLFLLNRLSSPFYVIAICTQSGLFLLITDKLGFLKSHHNLKRKTYGSPLFFVGVMMIYSISMLSFDKMLFVLPLLILTISDPLASFTGFTVKSRHWINVISGKRSPKTYVGSLAFFGSSLLILFFGLQFFGNFSFWLRLIVSITIALSAASIETISSGGFDNLTIPGLVVIILMLVRYIY